MKARDVSVGIQETNDGLNVLVHLKIKSAPLAREPACPDPPNCDPLKYGTRVNEGARRRKEKELQKILEAVEWPE